MSGSVLSPEEWEWLTEQPSSEFVASRFDGQDEKIIAVANFYLGDSAPRKITRERIATLRNVLDRYANSLGPSPVDHDEIRAMDQRTAGLSPSRRFLKALESYLPPEAG